MNQEQQRINKAVDELIQLGNKTIYLNSRARKLPFGARLRGAAFESCLPLALILFAIGITCLVRWWFLVAFSL